jgi:hypothetical protein
VAVGIFSPFSEKGKDTVCEQEVQFIHRAAPFGGSNGAKTHAKAGKKCR